MKVVLFTAIAAFAGLAISASAVAAEPPTGARQMKVSFGDLDLTKPAGADAMIRRMKQAASTACGGRPDFRDIAAQRFHSQCVASALDDAIWRLDAPLVTNLYHDKAGPRLASRANGDR